MSNELPTLAELKKYIKQSGFRKPSRKKLMRAFNVPDALRNPFKKLMAGLKDDSKKDARAPKDDKTHSERLIGVVVEEPKGLVAYAVKKKFRHPFVLSKHTQEGLVEGDIVLMQEKQLPFPTRGKKLQQADVMEKKGSLTVGSDLSELSILQHELPTDFSPNVLKDVGTLDCQSYVPDIDKGKRKDLRALPFVTIDGEDAKDFDDAVYAEPHKNGFKLMVAIADVAHYVKYGTMLDKEAYERGNSVYFPGKVLPMLPERLSNDLCSLVPHEDRPVLVVEMLIDKNGQLREYTFFRGVICSKHRFTYNSFQHEWDNNNTSHPLWGNVISPLMEAYKVLFKARRKREALEIETAEWKVLFSDTGEPFALNKTERFDSHKLIEEFMVLANVAAAKALDDDKDIASALFRIHETPDNLKIENLKQQLIYLKLLQNKEDIGSHATFNEVLGRARGTGLEATVSELVLRAQSQAKYHPKNIGHFGLNLTHYTHFTSPIRRYSDLIIHRALIKKFALGEDGISPKEIEKLSEIGLHLSDRERLAAEAERETLQRYVTQYMQQHLGQTFEGRVSSVRPKGLFVSLDEIGVSGLLPVRELGREYFIYDEARSALTGSKSGQSFTVSDRVNVAINEVNVISGFVNFSYAPHSPRSGKRKSK